MFLSCLQMTLPTEMYVSQHVVYRISEEFDKVGLSFEKNRVWNGGCRSGGGI